MNKNIRYAVYAKYNGHCAYCGCEIDYKDMQVDHIKPKCRNNETTAERHLGGVGEDSIENFNPSCRMCNFYKGMYTIEQFRRRLRKNLGMSSGMWRPWQTTSVSRWRKWPR